MKIFSMFFSFLFSLLFLVQPLTLSAKTLKAVVVDREGNKAVTYAAEMILKQHFGDDLKIEKVSIDKAYSMLANGEADLFFGAWLPKTEYQYYSPYKDKIEILSLIYPNAKVGLVVPYYAPANSIEDLESMKGIFDTRIIGINRDSAIMNRAREALDRYGLIYYELIPYSDKGMNQTIRSAIKNRRNIIITGWEPHDAFNDLQLKFLKDPLNVFGDNESIYIISRKGFVKDNPKEAELLKAIHLSPLEVAEFLQIMENHKDNPQRGIEIFVEHNPNFKVLFYGEDSTKWPSFLGQ